MNSDPAGEQINGGWVVINGGPCPCCGQAEGNMCRCAAVASLLAAKDAMVNEANAERDRLAAEVERLQRELAAAHDENAKRGSEILDLQQENEKLRNTIQTLSERLTAALEAKSTAETESQRANEFVNVFRADMEKLAAENAELRRDAEQCRGRAKRYRTWITEQFTGGLPLHVAQKLDLCRICGQVPSIPLVLNYGKEYACQKCLDELDAALKEAK